MKFKGCGTALVTPFRSNGSIDEETLRKLIRRQIAAGIDFIVPCGTTGESPTLSHEEHLRVVEIAVEEARGKVPVLGGAGGYNTAHVIELAKELEKLGVDGILSVTPYYNKPSQEGLFQHFKAVAEAIGIPIILYSVQPRTNVNIEPQTVERLTAVPNIIGIKEASGNINQIGNILNRVPSDFLVLSGDDSMTLPLLALGGHGLISVASNEIPGEITALVAAGLSGDYKKARELHHKYLPLMDMNFIEPNPQPAKCAMQMMGLLEANFRLPLVPVTEASEQKIRTILTSLNLLEERSLSGVR